MVQVSSKEQTQTPSFSVRSFQQRNEATQEMMQLRSRQRMKNTTSLKMAKASCCTLHRGPSSRAMTILIIVVACIQNQWLREVVHAYSPSIGIAR